MPISRKGMKRAPRRTLGRASATAALLLLRSALLPPSTASATTVALTARTVEAQQKRVILIPPQACQEFYETEAVPAGGTGENNPGNGTTASFWQASDCMDVWASWTATLPVSSLPSYADRQRLRERAADMRRRGASELAGRWLCVAARHLVSQAEGGFRRAKNFSAQQ